jgi:hypothetical protein
VAMQLPRRRRCSSHDCRSVDCIDTTFLRIRIATLTSLDLGLMLFGAAVGKIIIISSHEARHLNLKLNAGDAGRCRQAIAGAWRKPSASRLSHVRNPQLVLILFHHGVRGSLSPGLALKRLVRRYNRTVFAILRSTLRCFVGDPSAIRVHKLRLPQVTGVQ